MGEVYMPDFVLCWDESQEQYYAFRSQTGETIYGASEVATFFTRIMLHSHE